MMFFDDRDRDDGDDDFEKADGQHPLCKTNVGAAAGGAACTSCGRQEAEGASLFFLCTSMGGGDMPTEGILSLTPPNC